MTDYKHKVTVELTGEEHTQLLLLIASLRIGGKDLDESRVAFGIKFKTIPLITGLQKLKASAQHAEVISYEPVR